MTEACSFPLLNMLWNGRLIRFFIRVVITYLFVVIVILTMSQLASVEGIEWPIYADVGAVIQHYRSFVDVINRHFLGRCKLVPPNLAIIRQSEWGQMPSSTHFGWLVQEGPELFDTPEVCFFAVFSCFRLGVIHEQIAFCLDAFCGRDCRTYVFLDISEEIYIICIFQVAS